MSKLRILHTIYSLEKGGGEKYLIDLCNELKNYSEIETLIVVFDNKNSYPELTKYLDIQICHVKIKLSVLRKTQIENHQFCNIVNTFKPHIIHSHLYMAEIISRSTIFPNIKYVSHLQGFEDRFFSFTPKIFFSKKHFTNYFERHWLIKKYRESKNNFLAISNGILKYYKNTLPKDLKTRVTLFPNSIPIDRYLLQNKKITISNPIKLISVGSLIKRKNHSFLIDVMHLLGKSSKKFTLDILGEGECRKELENKIKQLNLEEKVFLRGNTTEVETYLQNSSAYLHSATYEPFGLVIVEGMAAGLPVVILDGNGNRDLIQQGYNGYLLSEANPKKFANLILKIFDDENQYLQMSENAIEFSKKFDIKNTTKELVTFYKELVLN